MKKLILTKIYAKITNHYASKQDFSKGLTPELQKYQQLTWKWQRRMMAL